MQYRYLLTFLLVICLACSTSSISLTEKNPKLLVIYDSTYGSTEKITQWIGEGIENGKRMFTAKVAKVSEINKDDELEGFDFILLGSPIYKGDISDGMKQFLGVYSHNISKKPFGIFVVCGTPLVHGERWLERFEKLIGKKTQIRKAFGGRLVSEKLIPAHRERLEGYWEDRGVDEIKGFDYLSEKEALEFGRQIKEEFLQ